jgi:hydroxymethylbilane synthase
MTILTVGTRTSQLALWQTNHVIELLQTAWPDLQCEQRHFVTKGDKTLDQPLPVIGGKGLFTAELEQALLNGEIDLAVHSLKDLPVRQPDGLTLGAIPPRADVRDVFIGAQGYTIATLPEGAVVGTSSLRRQAQLLVHRPDLIIRSIRGNVDTRLRKAQAGEYDGVILAAAGLIRLNLTDPITEWLPLETMLPAPGQGALAVQCRADDTATLERLAAIHDEACAAATHAERAFLTGLGGGCAAPIAAHAQYDGTLLRLAGFVATPDGRRTLHIRGEGEDPFLLGYQCAQQALAEGAKAFLS